MVRLRHTFGFHRSCLREWVKKYVEYGEEGLNSCTQNKLYTREFKENVVEDYLSGIGSELDLALKYGIPSRRTC